jgi:hypothetical protein
MIDNKKEKTVSDGEMEDYSELTASILYRDISEAIKERDKENDDVK